MVSLLFNNYLPKVKWILWNIRLRDYLTIILWNRAEYRLLLSRWGRRPSWLNLGDIPQDWAGNCFIIQQILIDIHVQKKKNQFYDKNAKS